MGERATDDGPWVDEWGHAVELAAECSRRILGRLHFLGHYRHFVSPCYPGRVLCVHKDSPVEPGWEPTAEQRRLDEALARRKEAQGG